MDRKGASTDHHWLRYLGSENGLFGLYGVLFNSSDHAFVKDPVNDWGNLTNLIEGHLGRSGHRQCLEMDENFTLVAEGRSVDVLPMLSSSF